MIFTKSIFYLCSKLLILYELKLIVFEKFQYLVKIGSRFSVQGYWPVTLAMRNIISIKKGISDNINVKTT